ncbi:Gfo/Idh/MocA family oxidoreductase [Anaeroselena agilis]|uniref:Gfo/Idh/MocA family oxidoreductase n=1 Tax=Anaeroselena agilis TaxID=3063788 RepID=A0ABU3P4A4_9FIRM|nr:Gfo/Idh/MocA family oxidoreductase [Selenomonadales bacterium 4137-cl]
MQKIYIIGAGQLGSRHLQALKHVRLPLAITVIDPSADSLAVARERYDAFATGQHIHQIEYTQHIPHSSEQIDLAIVATNANIRKEVVTEALQNNCIKYMILEKLLFQKSADFRETDRLLSEVGTTAWVNCSMRVMPFYRAAKQEIAGNKILYQVTGSQYGLVTNAIHYLDHIAYLTGALDYELDTAMLDYPPIPSKRKGYLELSGNLTARYADGSMGVITCYPGGNAPVQVEILSQNVRMIVREAEGKAWVSRAGEDWQWTEADARILYQSEMTAGLVEDILGQGTCNLTPYRDSVKVHLNLLEPLLSFLNNYTQEKSALYPFT